ncbi:MAG: T9SS type A sorting domain-containing protein [Bacteroidia bacterium]|nr:T9SS type A sorting domain-containing protein [Bacteroidia bacterium]
MKINLQSVKFLMRNIILAGVASLAFGLKNLHAQVYLTENFDNPWVGSPTAPVGWTQVRTLLTGDGNPVALGTFGAKDWQSNRRLPVGWTIASSGTLPAAAVSDSGTLFLEDHFFGGNTNTESRRMESPVVSLNTATSPYVRFKYFSANASNQAFPLKVLASNDGGLTWATIADVQPNFTETVVSSASPWQNINIKVPAAYLAANAKFAFERNNTFSGAQPIFIDNFIVEEFTPTTITSAQTGLWNATTTWVGGVVPSADNNVVIAAGHTVSINVNIARTQNLTIDGTVNHSTTTTSQILQTFGDVIISSTGTLLGGNGTTGKFTYIGGSLNNSGILTVNQSTTATLYFFGGTAATITNSGTITGGLIPVIHHANTGGITYNSPVTIRNNCFLTDGNVNPNGNLTVGISGTAVVITRHPKARFTSRPLYPSLGTALRSVTYGGGTNGTLTFGLLRRDTIFTGFETDTISGTQIIVGTLTINTHAHVVLRSPLLIGTATVGGITTFTRGFLFTSPTNLLTINLLGNGSFGTQPSNFTPPTNQGSYIIGPVRFNRPASGSAQINIPFGVGTAPVGTAINSNVLKTFNLSAGAGWSSQTITFNMTNTPPTGTATGVNMIGNRYLNIDLNSGPDLPATSALTFPYNNYTFGNSDNILGTQTQLRVMQAALQTGPWTERSVASGTGGFTDNLYETRTTATAAPGPISPILTNGGFFALGTTAPKMVYDSTRVFRNTNTIAPGSGNQLILNVKVYVTGIVPVNVTNLAFTTAGTTAPANILNARVFYTGASTTFLTTTQVGATVSLPSGAFNVTGSQGLLSGENNFWLVYDVSPTATLGNILAANCTNVTVDGNVQTVTNPAAGGRQVAAAMTYVGQTTSQTALSQVETGSFDNRILDIQLQMSPTGASSAATQFSFNTNGSGNPGASIANAKLYYTGSSNTFSSAILVGTAIAPVGAFTITGNASLNNGTNYFWLTYDIRSTGLLGDSVDAEFVNVTIGATLQTVTGGSATGARYIRAPYCASTFTNPAADGEIWNVTIGSLNNTSNCTQTGGAGSILNSYSNYKATVPAPNFITGLPLNFSVNTSTCGGSFQGAMAIWIDLNQDGDFTDPGENVHATPLFNYGVGVFRNGTITIPCTALKGTTAMRVTLLETGTLPIAPCGTTFGFGETEDYLVNIVENTNSFISAVTTQQTGTTSAGALDVPILRVTTKVNANPCAPSTFNQFWFNTAGSTSAGNITAAKLYKTGTSQVFSTANLVGTVPSPSGAFSFMVTDTALNDTNTYWLAYDVSGSAPNSSLLDARIDSLNVYGSGYVPANNNPAGNVLVSTPMTYLSSTPAHPVTNRVARPSSNNPILRMRVITSSSGATVPVTSFNLSTNGGGIDTSNIDTIRVWYTGANSNFTTNNLFGTYVPTGIFTPSIGVFTVNGTQNLLNDTNYFWLTYGIKAIAVVGDSIDAEMLSVTFGGTPQTPTIAAPVGNRLIRNDYCAAINTGAFPFSCITNVQLNTLANNTSVTCPNNPSYTFFTNTTTVAKNTTYNLTVTPAQNGDIVGVWFDWNDNGIFDVSEFTLITGTGTAGVPVVIPITIPCNASTGIVRMRIRSDANFGTPITAVSSCTNQLYGETEDYNITVIDNPIAYATSRVIQYTGSVPPGAVDNVILQVKVKAGGCGLGMLTSLVANTSGSTTASNIVAAKLYSTGTSGIFNTNTLLATIGSPSGSMVFTSFNDTLNSNDTNNYWITYDVSPLAITSNLLDARVDSVQVLGNYFIPTNNNPAGNKVITSPMTYLGMEVTQISGKVETNSTNSPILRVRVITSSSGAPIDLTQMNFNTNGTTTAANIGAAKLFSTGTSSSFAATTQFGATVTAPIGAFVFNGTVALANDTNYFWLTYNIPGAAIVGDSVDGEVVSAVLGGTTQTPLSGAPAGSNGIRAPYCASTFTNPAGDGEIWNVTVGSLNNTSNCAQTGGAGSILNSYSNYSSTVAAPNLVAGGTVPFSIHTSTCGSSFNGVMGIWIDFNQDGDFLDAGETVHMTPSFLYGTTAFRTGNISIPCNASRGFTRMRVTLVETTVSPIASCGTTFGYGETEDYTVNILDNPPVYNSSTAIQQTGIIAPGTNDVPVLRIPVKASGCGLIMATDFTFNTAGSTSVGDIVSAKLYATGNTTVFNTSKLIGTITSPSGAFTFTTTDTLLTGTNDTNNYWLAYDVSSIATLTNTLDATFTNTTINGTLRTPTVSAPAGSLTINSPMSYSSSTVIMPFTSRVERGSLNNPIARLMVVTSSTGSPITATTIDCNTNGSAAPSTNITNAKIWYTGANPNFSTINQFGTTVAAPSGAYSFTGSRNLLNDTNYFWLTYDVPTGAVAGDSIDAEITSVTIGAIPRIPSITAPTGSRLIRDPYCASTFTNPAADGEIWNVTVGSLNNTSACTVVAPGPGSVAGSYSNFTGAVAAPNLIAGTSVNFSVHTSTCGGSFTGVMGIWIDLNQNGSLTDAGEQVVMTGTFPYGTTVFQTGSFTIPATALTGITRMRVSLIETTVTPILPCGTTFGYGETEDYDVNILPLPPPTNYVWNQTTAANFGVATNWTPNRTTPILNDILTFNGGGNVTVNGITPQVVGQIVVNNSTNVTFGASTSTITTNTLALTSGKINTGTAAIEVGTDTNNLGSITGIGSIEGSLTRWVNASSTVVTYPLTVGTNNRAISINFTSPLTTPGSINARFIEGTTSANGLPLVEGTITASKLAPTGIWRLTNLGTFGGTYTVTATATGFIGVNNFSTLVLARRNNVGTPWLLNGVHVTTTGSNAAPVLSRTGMSLFGEFGVIGDSTSNPLPVTLTSFAVKAIDLDAILNWSTSSETNNKGFDIERSLDGRNFEKVSFVKGAGNSNRNITYKYNDAQIFNNAQVLYYRLKQIDFDGKTTYSQVVRVTKNAESMNSMIVFPNPFNNEYNVSFNTTEAGYATVETIDIQGKVLVSKSFKTVDGLNTLNMADLSNLSAGIYFVKLSVNGDTQTMKLVKN